jgi:hypothetical protein
MSTQEQVDRALICLQQFFDELNSKEVPPNVMLPIMFNRVADMLLELYGSELGYMMMYSNLQDIKNSYVEEEEEVTYH